MQIRQGTAFGSKRLVCSRNRLQDMSSGSESLHDIFGLFQIWGRFPKSDFRRRDGPRVLCPDPPRRATPVGSIFRAPSARPCLVFGALTQRAAQCCHRGKGGEQFRLGFPFFSPSALLGLRLRSVLAEPCRQILISPWLHGLPAQVSVSEILRSLANIHTDIQKTHRQGVWNGLGGVETCGLHNVRIGGVVQLGGGQLVLQQQRCSWSRPHSSKSCLAARVDPLLLNAPGLLAGQTPQLPPGPMEGRFGPLAANCVGCTVFLRNRRPESHVASWSRC